MKSKKLLFSTCLSLLSIGMYIAFSSSSTAAFGVMGAANGAKSCGGGGCHSSVADTTTKIAFSGVPAAGYVAGTVYPVSITITNATKPKSGFDFAFSAGTITGNPANTMIMSGKELHHTAAFTAASGVTTINFNWTAPASGTVILNILGNAVNDNNATSGDAWAFKVYDIVAKPSAISTQNIGALLKVYPNPTTNSINIESKENIISAKAIGIMGNSINVDVVKNNNDTYLVNTSNLASGNYLLLLKGEKSNFHAFVSKQ
jgi:Secretion system C-terminal sorting domain